MKSILVICCLFLSISCSSQKADKIYTVVEQMPSFPGGESEMHRFLSQNLKIPSIPLESGIQGRNVVRFIVSEKGEINNIEKIRGDSMVCDSIISVIKRMPRWIPGKQNGKNVNVYYTIPLMINWRR